MLMFNIITIDQFLKYPEHVKSEIFKLYINERKCNYETYNGNY